MSLVKDMKIGMRLGLGFGLLLMITIAITIYGIISVLSVDKDYTYVMDFPNKRYTYLKDIEVDMMGLRSTVLSFAFNTGNADALDAMEKELNTLQADMSSIFDMYRANLQADAVLPENEKNARQASADYLKAMLDSYASGIAMPILMAARSHDRTGVRALLPQALGINDKIDVHFNILFSYYQDYMGAIGHFVTNETRETAKLLIALLIICVIIGIAVSIFIERGISNPIAELSTLSNNIVNGELNSEIHIETNDEIGLLSKNFRNMQSTIKDLQFDIQSLVRHATAGQLCARAEVGKYSGGWNDLMTELNSLLDAFDASRKAIVEGIRYASTIQKNLLPMEDAFHKAFSDSSVIWKPRDIVGGDIFWLKSLEGGSVLCICDCTGHGTPGALLSMLVVSSFEATINEGNYTDTANVIFELDQRLVNVLNVHMAGSRIKDGCDLAVLFIAKDGSVTISSANTHVFICDGKEVTQVKGQRLFVGEGRIKSREEIRAITIPANPDNKFYIASDGLYDQIGGESVLPFGYSRFKQIILDKHNEKQLAISDAIWEAFESYRGDQPRRDDLQLITFEPGLHDKA